MYVLIYVLFNIMLIKAPTARSWQLIYYLIVHIKFIHSTISIQVTSLHNLTFLQNYNP